MTSDAFSVVTGSRLLEVNLFAATTPSYLPSCCPHAGSRELYPSVILKKIYATRAFCVNTPSAVQNVEAR